MPPDPDANLRQQIVAHYTNAYDESKRLSDGFGQLERHRTEHLITRYLPPPRAVILDVGGAGGVYSFFMAALGHDVHLLDIVPKHIEQAQANARQPGAPPLASIRVGDALALPFADASADMVMMHGPLYHLVDRADRRQALLEAKRVLRPGGTLLAFAISRYAGAIYGLTKGLIYDPDYLRMIQTEVRTGRRTNPPQGAHTLPSAHFHLPAELASELEDAGLACSVLLGVVGPAWLVPDLDAAWTDPAKRHHILELASLLEHEPLLSPRILAVGSKNI
ncbi:MAG: class I SAM-dependent methyltransferase [Phycisphaeraceae bacterium]|nr:class I SAM-dependent methyltransferase [Phycisphaeraceae bacterium]